MASKAPLSQRKANRPPAPETGGQVSPVVTQVMGGSNRSLAKLFRKASSSAPSASNLRICSPDDPAEREAERVAAEVMRMPEVGIVLPTTGIASATIHRKCASCKDEGEQKVQRSATAESPGRAPSIVNQVLSQPGRPLPKTTRSFFESSMGANFSDVRIHDDSHAAQSATAVQAKAYTVGNAITFAAGMYNPHSESGAHLLAHELTHVVQQNETTSMERNSIQLQENGGGLQRDTDNSISSRSNAADVPIAEGSATASPIKSPTDDAVRPISGWSIEEKAMAAYDRGDIKQAFRDKINSLITPKTLCMAIFSFAAVFVASQFTPVGWAADIGIALTAAFAVPALYTAIDHLIRFANVRNAKTSEDLDQAGAELAAALAEIGVDAVILAVTHASGVTSGGIRPLEGRPPMMVTFGVMQNGQLVLVASETIPLTVSAGLSTQAGIAAAELPSSTMLMSQGSSRAGEISRRFNPPERERLGRSGNDEAKGILPKTGEERIEAVNSWTKEELEYSAEILRESHPVRQNEQRILGEDNVTREGSPIGANHRRRIQAELDLLRAIEKKLSGS